MNETNKPSIETPRTPIRLTKLFGTALNTLLAHPITFFPFCVLGFIQLLALEILYFIPRPPLSTFFSPIITRIWSDAFLHYPLDLVLLPKIYYYVQIVIFIFIGAFFMAVSVFLIADINHEKKATVGSAFKATLPAYVHVFANSVLSFVLFFGFTKLYSLLVARAMRLRSETGMLFWLKKIIILGEPYVQFFIGIFMTLILIFVIPIIVIEKKKFFSALALNFKQLWRSFGISLFVVLLPTLLYVPVLLLRSNITDLMDATLPEIQIVSLVLSVIMTLIIDAIVLTSITTYYLLRKELQ